MGMNGWGRREGILKGKEAGEEVVYDGLVLSYGGEDSWGGVS